MTEEIKNTTTADSVAVLRNVQAQPDGSYTCEIYSPAQDWVAFVARRDGDYYQREVWAQINGVAVPEKPTEASMSNEALTQAVKTLDASVKELQNTLEAPKT